MLNGYFNSRKHQQRSIYELFFRRIPKHGGFCVAAGLEQALDYLEALHFSDDDLSYLKDWAVPGRLSGVLKHFASPAKSGPSPKARWSSPTNRCSKSTLLCPRRKLVESALLNLLNFKLWWPPRRPELCYAAGLPFEERVMATCSNSECAELKVRMGR